MWRNYGDVTDAWNSVTNIIHYYGNNPQNFSAFTGPGGWADPDMVTMDQWIYWFSVWRRCYQKSAAIGYTLLGLYSVSCVVQLLAESVCVCVWKGLCLCMEQHCLFVALLQYSRMI